MLQFSYGVNDSVKKKPFIRISLKEHLVLVSCKVAGSSGYEFETFGRKNYRKSDYETKTNSISGVIHELQANVINLPNTRISFGLFYSTYKFQSKQAYYDDFTEMTYGHGFPGNNYVVDSTKLYYNGTDVYVDHLSLRGIGGSLGINFQKQIRKWNFEGDVKLMVIPKMKGQLKREYISTFRSNGSGSVEKLDLEYGGVIGTLYNIGASYKLYRSIWVSGGFNYYVLFSDIKGDRYYNNESIGIRLKNFNQFGLNLGLSLAF